MFRKTWRGLKRNIGAYMINTWLIRPSQVWDNVWYHLNKEWLQGYGKKISSLRYGPFKILEKVGNNSYKPNVPPYMMIYYVVNA